MNNQELYHKFSQWADGHYGERETKSMWRWVKDHLASHVSDEQDEALANVMSRLERGEPIQYITERAYFFDMELYVNDTVLIPRPETEELVFHVARQLNPNAKDLRLLDVGTGSGCIALGLKRQLPSATIMGCDVDEEALEVARINASRYDLEINFFNADFTNPKDFESLEDIDYMIANPPYILESEKPVMSFSTRFEPDLALFSPEGPMWAYEAIINRAMETLKPDGFLAMEMNEFHVLDIRNLAQKHGMKAIEVIEDMQGKDRVLRCQKPA